VADAKAWKAEYGLTYPVLADPNGTAWNKFGMGYIPHNTIIDDTMICRFTNYGFNETQLRNLLTTYSAPLVKIVHDFLPNTENTVDDYVVDATIYSGGNLLPATINVYWNTDGSMNYDAIQMTDLGNDNYRASIPAQPTGTTVYYYLHAEADNGKASNYPLTAPEEPAMFDVLVDTIPPVITHTPVEMWLADFWPATIQAEITDTLGIQTATLEFNLNGGSTQYITMINTQGNMYQGTFTGSVAQDDVINYRIRAVDAAMAQNEAVLPATGWFAMNISEMVDALVLDFDGNANSGPVIRDTLLSLGLDTHYMTEMPPLPELYKSIWVCLGVVPDNTILDAADDTALYNYLVSGHNIYLEGGNFWKDDPRVDLYFEFGIGTTDSGAGDAGIMNGEPGGLADGMSFNYTGDNNNIDRLKLKTGGVGVLRNATPDYLTMINKDGGSYKTIGSCVEFGGLTTGPATELLEAFAAFFGLDPEEPPTPTPTPVVTPTPTPPGGCDTLGVTLSMPGHDFGAGDTVNTIVTICNPGQTTYQNVPLFVILDVYGDMFFHPTYSDFDYTPLTVTPGEAAITILPDFPWPSGVGSADGIFWYAGMTNPEMTDLMGEFDMWEFGWH